MDVTETDMDAVVVEFYAPLYRFALSLAGSVAPASDLTQETFYRWLQHGTELRDPTKVKGWLFTTLYREFLRGNRRTIRFPHHDLEEVESELPVVDPADVGHLDGRLVMQALAQVDENYRAPLSLFYLESFSYSEIAEALGIPIGTVMSRLSRGRVELRRHLAALLSEEDRKVIPFFQAKAR